jgi:hypothetical protein
MSEKNLYENEDPLWQTRMQTLMRRTKSMETAQIIDEAIWKYYFNKGQEVPQWKMKKDPQWWIDYLISLGIDPKNP